MYKQQNHRVLRGRLRRFVVRAMAIVQVAWVGDAEARQPVLPADSPAAQPDVLAEYYRRAAGSKLSPKQRRALAQLLYHPVARSPAVVALATGYPVPTTFAGVLATAGPTSDRELLAALDEVEKVAIVDAWVVALLWNRLGDIPEPKTMPARLLRRKLLHRLTTHARLATALVRARAEVSRIEFAPWRSKAAPPPGYRRGPSSLEIAVAVGRHYKRADPGTWTSSAVSEVRVRRGKSGLDLIRGGQAVKLHARFTLGRLDLLETTKEVVLQTSVGPVTLPAGRQLSAWQLPTLVAGDTQKNVDALILSALAGDEQALTTLSEVLPFAHLSLRRAVQKSPEAKGAPGLRMLLALFDDAVVRTENPNPAPSPAP